MKSTMNESLTHVSSETEICYNRFQYEKIVSKSNVRHFRCAYYDFMWKKVSSQLKIYCNFLEC